jgi:hypothetical protein
VEAAKAISNNMDISNMIKNSPHSNVDPDRIPSPSNDFINSIIEDFTPLEVLLSTQFILNLVILILFILFFLY